MVVAPDVSVQLLEAAAKDGYRPQTRQVQVIRGAIVTSDFTLKKRGC